MDPNETLRQIREHIADYWREGNDQVYPAEQALELFVGLDEWLSRGGFPPEAWREGPDAFGEASPDEGDDEDEADNGLRAEQGDRHDWWNVLDRDGKVVAGGFRTLALAERYVETH